ncbi:H+-ATPase G subunit-domain-containing protein [Cercophora scortea]|uniref:V-type proton ATPase subunit G n=1 Tax=Cercophora scortea TaxID=314031 RepID=A0AAE0MHA4_9PEZI|nr:H+-ATPase G subunit-domain-containing protein [Cercophora scortea]
MAGAAAAAAVHSKQLAITAPTNDSTFSLASAQNSAGIQTLLDAEREASKIVQKAREYRTKRVKEARDEAKKEIDAYRAEKDAEFKKFESEHTQGNKQAEDEANKEAETKIAEIKQAGKSGEAKVVEELLSAVFEVNPHPLD